MSKPLDITGQRFGHLVALQRLNKKKQRCFIWLCQCDCGNQCEVSIAYLRNGSTTSCGCQKFKGFQDYNKKQTEEHLIPNGTRFGKLTVLNPIGYKPQYQGAKKNRMFYLCQCDCGQQRECSGNSLQTGNLSSCGTCLISKGEELVKHLLDSYNCTYNYNCYLPELINITDKRLRFDFIIYDKNNQIDRIVEVDGRQHIYGPDTNSWSRTKDALETIQERDNLKNKFCNLYGYKLIRIPFYKMKTITYEDIFSDKFLYKERGDEL